jgi:hypothetical protein
VGMYWPGTLRGQHSTSHFPRCARVVYQLLRAGRIELRDITEQRRRNARQHLSGVTCHTKPHAVGMARFHLAFSR